MRSNVDDLDAAVEQEDAAVPERDGQSSNLDAADAPDGGSRDLGATRDKGLDSDGGVPDAEIAMQELKAHFRVAHPVTYKSMAIRAGSSTSSCRPASHDRW